MSFFIPECRFDFTISPKVEENQQRAPIFQKNNPLPNSNPNDIYLLISSASSQHSKITIFSRNLVFATVNEDKPMQEGNNGSITITILLQNKQFQQVIITTTITATATTSTATTAKLGKSYTVSNAVVVHPGIRRWN